MKLGKREVESDGERSRERERARSGNRGCEIDRQRYNERGVGERRTREENMNIEMKGERKRVLSNKYAKLYRQTNDGDYWIIHLVNLCT